VRRFLGTRTGRLVLVVPFVGALVALAVWRGPEWQTVGSAFTRVRWEWVAAAVGINFVSVVFRSLAWKIVVDEALPQPHPRARSVFAAFCVGLLANAALPGRVGEVARIAVLARRLRELLDEHVVDGLGLDAAAELLHAHPAHLVRAFSTAYGIAPHQYLTSRRVDRARRLLLDGRAPGEVASATGFFDQSHLTRHFRKLVGVTPGRYRIAAR
jgi:AraC-like DNA-binding protein